MTTRSLLLLCASVAGCAVPAPVVHLPPAESRYPSTLEAAPRAPESGAAASPAAPPPAAAPRNCSPPLKLGEVLARQGRVHLPAECWQRALASVAVATCQCATKTVRVVATILPELGEVRAEAPDDPAVTACLKKTVDPARFEPFEAAWGSDCIDCGPRHFPRPNSDLPFPAPPPPPPRKPSGSKITTSIVYEL